MEPADKAISLKTTVHVTFKLLISKSVSALDGATTYSPRNLRKFIQLFTEPKV